MAKKIWELETLEECDTMEREIESQCQRQIIELELSVLRLQKYLEIFKATPNKTLLDEIDKEAQRLARFVQYDGAIGDLFDKKESLGYRRQEISQRDK